MLSRIPLLLLIAASGLHAGAAVNVDPLVATAAKHERGVLKATVEGHPLVETYLQYAPKGSSSPQKDTYSLGSIDQRKTLSEDAYQRELATKLSGRLLSLAKDIGIGNPEEVDTFAFADMLSPDIAELDGQHYRFEFRRYVFVGARRMALYDVSPASNKEALRRGRFLGRIWIDQQDAVIARYNGVFIGSSRDQARPDYLHFDSWRKRSVAGTWLPYAIYIEEPVRGSLIHGQLRFWGYHLERLNLQRDSSMTNIQVDNALDVSTSSPDVSPLEASNLWRKQAESNVMDRLESAGLLAPAGDFEKILDQIVINLSVPNNLDFSAPVHCRILLSLPIEATVADHTILLSKGLIDTVPTEEALASVLAVELAHIQLGHRLDTRYAFSDRMMFANTQTYENIRLVHTPADDQAAAKLAQKYIAASLYADKITSLSAYYSVLDDASRRLPELTHGYLADSLLGPDGHPWLHGWLQNVSLKAAYQVPEKAPLPLSSALKVDPENDQLHQILPRIGPSSPAEVHPFEILPVVLNYRSDDGAAVSALQSHLNADFTPTRPIQVSFDQIALADGTHLPLHATVVPGSGQVIRLVDTGSAKHGSSKNPVSAKMNEAKQEWQQAMQQIHQPGKMHRALRIGIAQLPVHPQYIDSGTLYYADLEEPLSFGSETVGEQELQSIGTPPPAGSVVRASLITPLDSATTKHEAPVEAVLQAAFRR